MNICRGLLTSTNPAPPVPVGLTDFPKTEPSLIPYTPNPNTLSLAEFNTSIIEAAANAALSGGPFLDTQIFAFSRKRPGGGADKPRAVYANSTVLRASCPYFADCEGSFLIEFRHLMNTFNQCSESTCQVPSRRRSLFWILSFSVVKDISIHNTITPGTVIWRM